MVSIEVKIDELSAEKWYNASVEKKELLAKSIEMLIDQIDVQNEDDFWQFVNKISAKAADNGLTENELQRIFNED